MDGFVALWFMAKRSEEEESLGPSEVDEETAERRESLRAALAGGMHGLRLSDEGIDLVTKFEAEPEYFGFR